MTILIGIIFSLLSAVLAITTLLGLPGIWLMIVLAIVVDLIQYYTTGDINEISFGIVLSF